MIIEFKVANYRSINAEQTLSFVADRATRHPDNLIRRPGYRLLKAVGLFGANASGKSNIVKAIGAMSAFVRDSATKMNDGDPILAAEPYRLAPETRDQPSRFEITFVTGGTVYTYGFATDSKSVHEEWLSAKQETSDKELFVISCIVDPQLGHLKWKTSHLPNHVPELLHMRKRENALFLSIAARENVKELLPVYRYLRERCLTYDVSSSANVLIGATARACMGDEKFRHQLEGLMHDADTGIESIRIKTHSFDNMAHSDGATPDLIKFALFDRTTALRTGNDGQLVEFDLERDESRGTQRLFGISGILLEVLKEGVFVAIDELDASMHPLLTRRLLEMFQSPEANPNGAQLLFTTHDPSLLDQELFRRDQIWLAEKCAGASTFFSLADIQPPIRNTEAFLGNYLTGRYGGTPHLGPAFDMVETGSKA